MNVQPVMIPLHPYSEPQRRWLEGSGATIRRYLDRHYDGAEDPRALASTFLHVAADAIWEADPDAPTWERLNLTSLLLHLASAPAWDDVWLLQICATVSSFYRWLEHDQGLRSERAAAIVQEADRRVGEALESLGLQRAREQPS